MYSCHRPVKLKDAMLKSGAKSWQDQLRQHGQDGDLNDDVLSSMIGINIALCCAVVSILIIRTKC